MQERSEISFFFDYFIFLFHLFPLAYFSLSTHKLQLQPFINQNTVIFEHPYKPTKLVVVASLGIVVDLIPKF